MLTQLVVDNLGLIASTKIDLTGGLQVVTGETGVGKSLLLRSLSLLSGARARVDWIRTGADEARVSGYFVPSDEIRETLNDILGETIDDGLLIERRLRRTGRHSQRLNGREVPLNLLQQVGGLFLEIHGQNAQLSLKSRDRQLEVLDRFAGVMKDRAAFGEIWREARRLARELEAIHTAARERHDRALYLSHVLDDLDGAALEPGEREALQRELGLLEERDRVAQLIQTSLLELYEGEPSLLDTLAAREREMTSLMELHTGLREFVEGCATARVALEEAVRSLRDVEEDLERDPARLEAQRTRMDQLVRLEERFQRPGDELINYREEVRAELAELRQDEERSPELERELGRLREDLGRRAARMGRRRRKAAQELAQRVTAELRDLGMSQAGFEVDLTPLGDGAWEGLSETGADQAEIVFSPNPGEPGRPLRESASGGELSRVMLSLKRVLADSDGVETLVFDEIDAGVGGRLGMELGHKLRQIGETHQVLCVTHLPQVASYAHGHLHVAKNVVRKRTTTSIAMLLGEERVREIAIMIRGEGHSETSVAEAREMITEATSAC